MSDERPIIQINIPGPGTMIAFAMVAGFYSIALVSQSCCNEFGVYLCLTTAVLIGACIIAFYYVEKEHIRKDICCEAIKKDICLKECIWTKKGRLKK